MFECVYHEEYPLKVHFTRETWHGRMKACRGIGASLTETEIASWKCEHLKLLTEIAPEEFACNKAMPFLRLDDTVQ